MAGNNCYINLPLDLWRATDRSHPSQVLAMLGMRCMKHKHEARGSLMVIFAGCGAQLALVAWGNDTPQPAA